MNKVIVIICLLCAVGVTALAEEVLVINFHYDNGVITVKDSTQMKGYYPDRIYQQGYRADIVSIDDNVLYSFRFKLPTEVFTDIENNGKLSGGVVRLNETDFSLIVPYFEEAKEIVFYNERDYKIASGIISMEYLSPGKGLVTVYIVLSIGFIVGLVYLRKRSLS